MRINLQNLPQYRVRPNHLQAWLYLYVYAQQREIVARGKVIAGLYLFKPKQNPVNWLLYAANTSLFSWEIVRFTPQIPIFWGEVTFFPFFLLTCFEVSLQLIDSFYKSSWRCSDSDNSTLPFSLWVAWPHFIKGLIENRLKVSDLCEMRHFCDMLSKGRGNIEHGFWTAGRCREGRR